MLYSRNQIRRDWDLSWCMGAPDGGDLPQAGRCNRSTSQFETEERNRGNAAIGSLQTASDSCWRLHWPAYRGRLRRACLPPRRGMLYRALETRGCGPPHSASFSWLGRQSRMSARKDSDTVTRSDRCKWQHTVIPEGIPESGYLCHEDDRSQALPLHTYPAGSG